MGDYTGVRCKVIIKPQYRQELEYLHNEISYEWDRSNLEFMREYGKDSRATFIPRGSLSYMPDEWEDTPKKSDGSLDYWRSSATDGFERNFNQGTGIWTFQCSLKNYDDTIENFFENVLSEITEEVIHLEKYFESWTYSKLFSLVNGKIEVINEQGIKYGYDANEEYGEYMLNWDKQFE